MTNFSFLAAQKDYQMFAPACLEAEKVLHTSPAMCAIGCRKALELAIKWVYAVDNSLQIPYKDNLQALMHEPSFHFAVAPRTWNKLPYIVKLGNLAVHSNQIITETEARQALFGLFEFIGWLDYSYGKNYQPRTFNPTLIPTEKLVIDTKKIKEQESLLQEKQAEIEKYKQELASHKQELTKLKQKNQEERIFTPQEIPTEWETRKRYIDVDLKLLGWDFKQYIAEEFEVNDMMGIQGQKGYIDYVLFGKDGSPLALVEAKRTTKDPRIGKQQAKLYADCLERRFGRRPMIFLTNGFETLFWDDTSSPERVVFSIFSQNDLQKLMNRRKDHRKLNELAIKDEITNRYYQKAAIRAVCSQVEQGFRKALLVMATGTGKTRTAISLTDVLTRGNYATNILFLADRTALVSQAKSAFKEHLPNMSLCNLQSNKDNKNARIVFSTYPTMLNAIDSAKTEDGEMLYTPAHFDLIIVDEAHRSIFKKYRTIFDYFDAIVVGLTATPKTEVDRNTYDFFELEQNVPTHNYDYETAVKEDKVLVPYHNIEVKTKFLENGIVYDELSDSDKERYEEDFIDEEGKFPEEIPSNEINEFIFNKNTVDKVLKDLMTNGIKVQGGSIIGKTIIFAQTKRHAQFIVDCFNKMYPQLNGGFIKKVICDDSYVQTIIEEFKDEKSYPQICVSVDMMDTGIDVPEIVNLVFFKKVKSKTKFWQMIGRGTRLCSNLNCVDGKNNKYADKKYFYIFDYLGNFEFFRANKNGIEGTETQTLSEAIFSKKIKLIYHFQDAVYLTETYQTWRQELIKQILSVITSLPENRVDVRHKRKYLEQFKTEKSFEALSEDDCADLIKHIAPLIIQVEKDEQAQQFDNFMYGLMLAELESSRIQNKYKNKLARNATDLCKKSTIPQVQEKIEFIKKVADIEFLNAADIAQLEKIRVELRDLIKFLVSKQRKIVFTDVEDVIIGRSEGQELPVDDTFENYKEKVNRYILEHTNHLAIYKLRHNKPLTEEEFAVLESILTEKLGSKADYNREFKDTPLGVLVRKIAKMDKEATMTAFSQFINDQSLNQQQIVFIHKIIDNIVLNGYLEPSDLIKAPFDRPQTFIKMFDKEKQIALVQAINDLNKNAFAKVG